MKRRVQLIFLFAFRLLSETACLLHSEEIKAQSFYLPDHPVLSS